MHCSNPLVCHKCTLPNMWLLSPSKWCGRTHSQAFLEKPYKECHSTLGCLCLPKGFRENQCTCGFPELNLDLLDVAARLPSSLEHDDGPCVSNAQKKRKWPQSKGDRKRQEEERVTNWCWHLPKCRLLTTSTTCKHKQDRLAIVVVLRCWNTLILLKFFLIVGQQMGCWY